MADFKGFIKPNKFKIILFFVLIIPMLFVSFLTSSLGSSLGLYSYKVSISWAITLGIVLGYLVSCTIDFFIKNNTIKIVIASFMGFISIVIAYIVYKMFSEPMISDPIHIPIECELACREIIENVTNRTAEISQKFQECMQNCYK